PLPHGQCDAGTPVGDRGQLDLLLVRLEVVGQTVQVRTKLRQFLRERLRDNLGFTDAAGAAVLPLPPRRQRLEERRRGLPRLVALLNGAVVAAEGEQPLPRS